MEILIVEDDVDISNLLCELLTKNRYSPCPAFSGTEALLRCEQKTFDLVLLDLMLPGKSGAEVLRELRKTSQTPVIVLTAMSDKDSVVSLLEDGANDYVTKPFDNRELLARIGIWLKAQQTVQEEPACLQYKDIVLDEEGFDAVLGGQPARLSKTEYEILKLLMKHPKKVFTKNNLYESVWGGEFFGDDNTINVHISKMRNKLAKLNPDTEYIQTVWGLGFKMQEER